ncbi:MAG: hypothetical protein ACP6IY_20995 [Promethearchaeia archaeon]
MIDIRKYTSIIVQIKENNCNEADTKGFLIEPLLKDLGWMSVDNISREYRTTSGDFIDYALKNNKNPLIYIEAKSINNNLNNIKEISRAIEYAIDDNIDWLIMTNGNQFKIYYVPEREVIDRRTALNINILNGENIEFLEYFQKERVINGSLNELKILFQINKFIVKLLDMFNQRDQELIIFLQEKFGDLSNEQINEILDYTEISILNRYLPEGIVEEEIIDIFEDDDIAENLDMIEIELPSAQRADIPAWKRYNYIPIPMKFRSFFPGYREEFIIHTDNGDINTWVTSATRDIPIGERMAGTYISKGITEYYREHSNLKPGDRLIVTKINDFEYNMEILYNH